MRRKGWLTPILVFIICISFLLSYQAKQGGASLAYELDPPSSPWNIDISHITKIEFEESNKSLTAFVTEDTWQLLTPVQMMADSTYIYNILSNFSNPQFIEEVETNITDLTEYNIDKFSKSLTLYDTNYTEYELICGKEASSSTYYVYSPNTQSIYTMHKSVFDALSYDLSLWRDKDFLRFNPDATTKIKIYTPSMTHIIDKPSTDSHSFSSATLAEKECSAIIGFLKSTRINTFITDNASENIINIYGLDKPYATVSIWEGNKEVRKFSIIEALEHPGQSYVLLEPTKDVFLINSFNIKK